MEAYLKFMKDSKPTIQFYGDLDLKFVPQRSFDDDMKEVAKALAEDKLKRKNDKLELERSAAEASTRAQDLMRQACKDLLYGLRPVRKAFQHWCEVYNIDRTGGGISQGGGWFGKNKTANTAGKQTGLFSTKNKGNNNDGPATDENMNDLGGDDVFSKIKQVTAKRREEANETTFQSYLDTYNVSLFSETTKIGGDKFLKCVFCGSRNTGIPIAR